MQYRGKSTEMTVNNYCFFLQCMQWLLCMLYLIFDLYCLCMYVNHLCLSAGILKLLLTYLLPESGWVWTHPNPPVTPPLGMICIKAANGKICHIAANEICNKMANGMICNKAIDEINCKNLTLSQPISLKDANRIICNKAANRMINVKVLRYHLTLYKLVTK